MASIWSEISYAPTPSVFEHRHILHEKIIFHPKSSFSWNDINSKVAPARKKVRFNAFADYSKAKVPIISKTDKRTLWWRKAEMSRMKSQAQVDAKNDFRARNYLNSFHRVYNRVVDGEANPVSEVEKLVLTVGVAMGYRGMEMWGGSAVGAHRLKRMKWVVEGVLHVQKKSFGGNLKPEQRAEILRLTSEYLSRPSHHLAALIGETDAKAAHIENPLLLENEIPRLQI